LKKPYLLALAGIILIIILFSFGSTVDKNRPVAPPSKVIADFNILNAVDSSKKLLNPVQISNLQKLEDSLNHTSGAGKIAFYSKLAAFWKDSARSFFPYAYYLIEEAKLENSENKLTFAAHLMLDNLRMQQDEEKAQWLTNQSVDLFNKALALNPTNDDLRVGLGSAYIYGAGRAGNPEATMQGIKELMEVAQRDSNNLQAQLVLGVGGMISGQFDKARDRFLKIVNKDPNNLEAIAYLADTYATMGQKDEAIKWYNISKKLANNSHYSKEVDERIKQLK